MRLAVLLEEGESVVNELVFAFIQSADVGCDVSLIEFGVSLVHLGFIKYRFYYDMQISSIEADKCGALIDLWY